MKAYPKRHFGQHFLRDTGVLDRIIRCVGPSPEDLVVEIGAGDGSLSVRLAPMVSRLIAIEVDSQWIEPLEIALAPYPQASIIEGDILELDLSSVLSPYLHPQRRLLFVGNLPFYISTAIIERLFAARLPIAEMVFMVQREVAERLIAAPGSRQYGILSVLCQHRSAVRIRFHVSAGCFVPRPKVMSSVISLHPYETNREFTLEQHFDELVKAAFGHRRKTLSNSLSYHQTLGPMAKHLLSRSGINGARRPEALSIQEYELLAIEYYKQAGAAQLGFG